MNFLECVFDMLRVFLILGGIAAYFFLAAFVARRCRRMPGDDKRIEYERRFGRFE